MNGFIRVSAYYGEPQLVGNIPTRAGGTHDCPVTASSIVNDIDNEIIKDMNSGGKESDYTIEQLDGDFEDEYGCKVGFGAEVLTPYTPFDGTKVHEFNLFEPNWADVNEAVDVIEDLTHRLVDWVNGYPSGR